MPSCQVCQSNNFTVDAGFSVCDDCGTRSQFQELAYEGYFEGIDNRLAKSTIKAGANEQKSGADLELTSWEEYNYIILGLVNELINLGAKKELKLTALQLWSAYLRANEVAFFSRKGTKVPKLSTSFKKKDAEIIYNLKIEKRKRARSTKSSAASSKLVGQATGSEARRLFRKTQRSLMRSEYEAYQTELESNTSMSVLNRSTDGGGGPGSTSGRSSGTSASSAPITIQFSSLARRYLKKTMPKKHLHKHEQNAQLQCHAFTRKNYARHYHPEILSRNTVFELLYLALNQCGDPMQLGDMLRFIKEAHLTFSAVLKFFPPDMRPAQKHRILCSFNSSKTSCPAHAYVRFGSRQLVRLLGVQMRTPNLLALARRYVAELALPPMVATVIETLLTICPPQMRLRARGKQQMPLYEGRAVAYVLFAVKLLFGVDDEREVRMSEAAQRVNRRLREMPGSAGQQRTPPLFVWSEWQRYVQMRNVILGQCHYATAQQLDPNGSAGNAHLFAEHLRAYEEQAEHTEVDNPDAHRKNDRESMSNLGIIFGKARQVHEKSEAKRQKDEEDGRENSFLRRTSLKFQPTLLPKSSYLERLLEDAVMSANVHIPAFMYTDHSARDMLPYLRPSELRKRFAASSGNVQRVRIARIGGWQQFHIDRPFREQWPEFEQPFVNAFSMRTYDFDMDEEEWEEVCQRSAELKQEEVTARRTEVATVVEANLAAMKSALSEYRAEKLKGLEVASLEKAASEENMTDERQTEILNDSIDLFSQRLRHKDTDDENEAIQAGQQSMTQKANATIEPDDLPGSTEHEPETDQLRASSPRREPETPDAVPLFEMILSEDEVDESDDENDEEVEGEPAAEDAPLEFLVNDFDYWMCHGRLDEMKYSVFLEMAQRTLPQNFTWLLRQCSQLVECEDRDVYRELMIIENFYAYRLAPFERMNHMVLYRAARRKMHIPELSASVLRLSPCW